MSDKVRILLVEADRAVRNFMATILSSKGYSVIQSVNGKEAISSVASNVADLVLLELMLPDMDGMDVLCSIRSWSEIPVIIVSAREEEADKVDALDAGANDYVTKPFNNNELLARIRSALRQHEKLKNSLKTLSDTFSFNGLNVNYARRLVFIDDEIVHLTPIEYRILALLSRNVGRVLTHDYIIREIWGPYSSDRQVLWVNMANIRRKIEPCPADPIYIFTQVGVGYRMGQPESPEKISDKIDEERELTLSAPIKVSSCTNT